MSFTVQAHSHPTFTFTGDISSSGAWSLYRAPLGSGSYYKYTMTFYVKYNDGSYEHIYTDNGTGSSFSVSGQLAYYSGKTSAVFCLHCGDTACDTSGATGTPGLSFGNTFTLYRAPSNVSATLNNVTTTQFDITVSWTNGTRTSTAYITHIAGGGVDVRLGTSSPARGSTVAGKPNTKYDVHAWINDGGGNIGASGFYSRALWTKPQLNSPTVNLVSGSEHNSATISITPTVSSSYDQFAYKLGNGSWSSWTTNKTYTFTGLSQHTSYTLYAKMKNTNSGYESAEVSGSLTTWYNPISSLVCNLVNKWFWSLDINARFSYDGTITKYEFSIGDESYQNKGTSNSYNKGTQTSGATGNLNANTNYTCKVKLTDNHGRISEASATFKTLDDRPVYLNGNLKTLNIVESNGTVKHITPNLVSVIKSDGTVINMNKIINNDSRTTY